MPTGGGNESQERSSKPTIGIYMKDIFLTVSLHDLFYSSFIAYLIIGSLISFFMIGFYFYILFLSYKY